MNKPMIVMLLSFFAVFLLVFGIFPALFPNHTGDMALLSDAERKKIQEKRKKAIGSLMAAAILFTGLLFLDIPWVLNICLTIIGSFLFYFVCHVMMLKSRKKRERFFEERMLDFLVLVSNNLKSGFALPNAIDIASKSIGGVLGKEFNGMMAEYRLGMELGEAIHRMNQRISSENLQLFAATVSIAIRTGSSISLVIDRLIFTIRKRNEINDKLKALTAQFDFEAVMMSFMPFIAFGILYLLDPEMMSPLITTMVGWCVLVGIVLLEMIGFFVMKKISAIKM